MQVEPGDVVFNAGRKVFPFESDAPGGSGNPDADREAQSLCEFICHAWPIVEPATPFIPGKHLDAIVQHLEAVTHGQIRRLLINIPPRHMKSLAVSVFWPVWEWINHPHRRWLFASYAQSLSIRDAVRSRRLIESHWFQSRWHDRFALTTDQNQKMRYDNNKTGCRIATSVDGSATGEGGDRVVADDPHNVTERESEAVRSATLEWWDQTMSTRLNNPKTGARIIVMQRVHEKDLAGHVLEQGGYTHLFLPAEFEPGRKCVTYKDPERTELLWEDWRTKEGDLLWPERITQSEIADFKLRLGPSGYAGQFQQRPAPAGGNRFRQEWFRYYTIADDTADHECSATPPERPCGSSTVDLNAVEGDELKVVSSHAALRARRGTGKKQPALYRLTQPNGDPKWVAQSNCDRFAVMDPAGTEPTQNSRPCYTVIRVWDITPDHDMLLVHQYRAQVQTPDATAAAERIARDYEVEYLGVEKDGIGLGIVQALKRSGLVIRAIKARGSKEARSESAEIRMAAGQIYFPRGADFLWDLEQELIHFPKGEYADQVDALAHAARMVQAGPAGPTAEEPAVDVAVDEDNWM
jgi:predicted phage terminase large subunit-like protein